MHGGRGKRGIGGMGDEELGRLRKEKEGEGMTEAEVKKMIEKKQLEAANELKEKFKTFLLDTELIPKELVFIGRAMRILQANNQAMGSYLHLFTQCGGQDLTFLPL